MHIKLTMNEWGYKSSKVSEHCDLLKQENDHFLSIGLDND